MERRNFNDYIKSPPSRKGTTPTLKKEVLSLQVLDIFWSGKFRFMSFMATRGCCGTGSLLRCTSWLAQKQVFMKIQPLNFKYEWHQVFVHWHNYLYKDVSYLWQLLLSSSIEMKVINFHEVFIYRLGKPTKSKHCHADLRIGLQLPSSPAQHWEESVWGRICCGRHLSSPKAAHNHPLRAKVI